MAEIRAVPTAYLIPPDYQMRKDSLYEDMEEFKESLAQNGLQQPIGVTELETGEFQIVWGMRRATAAKELGWETIKAVVHAPGEIDVEMAKAHENFHRTQLDPLEEGEYYAYLIAKHQINITECARRCRRSASHVSRMLALVEGHPDVREALRLGRINTAQAVEINKSDSPGWIAYALRYAQGNGISAPNLARWREQAAVTGEAQSLDQVLEDVRNNPQPDYRQQNKCALCGEWFPIENIPIRAIDDTCWHGLLDAGEHYMSCAWRNNAPPPPEAPKPITVMSREELLATIEALHKQVAEHMP